MHGENFLINDGRDWQTVKAVGERLPQFNVVPTFACTANIEISARKAEGDMRRPDAKDVHSS